MNFGGWIYIPLLDTRYVFRISVILKLFRILLIALAFGYLYLSCLIKKYFRTFAACHMPHVKLTHCINLISIFQYDHHNKLATCRLPHAKCQTYILKIFSFFLYQYANIIIYLPLAACHMTHVKLIHWQYILFMSQ